MILFAIACPGRLPNEHKRRKNIANFDAIGSVLLLAATVLVVFGLQQGGTGAYAWDSAVVITTLVIGCICWPALFIWEFWLSRAGPAGSKDSPTSRWSKVDAIYPTRLFSHRVLLAGIMWV